MAYGRIPAEVYAIRPPYLFSHNVGLLSLQITNLGLIGNRLNNDLSAGWRGNEYLYQSGLWVGAIGSDSERHVSTADPPEFRPELSPVWTIYESREGIRGGNRVGSGNTDRADDDQDDLVDEDFQNGFDDDGDGLVDEDFEAIGQQMFSCTYRDNTPEAASQVPDHVPLDIEVRQRSFQWSTTGINEFVGFDFEIRNVGNQRLKEVYLGFFSDSDVGPKAHDDFWTDDLVGWSHIDTTVTDERASGACSRIDLAIDTAFMWDAPDNQTTVTGGDVSGVFGSLFLGHTTDDTGVRAPQRVGLTTVAWFSASGQNSDPQNDDERYDLLRSGAKPARNAAKPDDYRYVIAAGPFSQLNPGESLSFQTAYVIGEGQDGFRANAVNAQRVYDGIYVDGDGEKSTGVNGLERCLRVLEQEDEILWDDPCDTLAEVRTIRWQQGTPCTWVDADCNPCTGVDGRETLINWVGTIAPPAPALNTDPGLDPVRDPTLSAFLAPGGDRCVTLQWDNASELHRDPISGEGLFTGYQVWRADNWRRPEGSVGPAPEEWMKIAEFRPDSMLHADPQVQGTRPLRTVRRVDVDWVGRTEDGRPIYPVGRYQYEDSLGIINGKVYFYAVTGFAITRVRNGSTGEYENVVLGGQPTAVEAEVVVPRWDPGPGCGSVRVVPNPYRGQAAWDLIPSDRDPTGSKIAFRNLPATRSTIRIYTLAGDLVREAEHDGSGGDGTWFWNLLSRNGQVVTSGIYLYSVDTGSAGECRGRFVIVR